MTLFRLKKNDKAWLLILSFVVYILLLYILYSSRYRALVYLLMVYPDPDIVEYVFMSTLYLEFNILYIVSESEPWGTVDLDMIEQKVDAGQVLVVDRSIPQPYYDVVWKGLQQHPKNRTFSLQSLCQTIQHDIKVGLTL